MLDIRVKRRQGDFSIDAAFRTQEVGVTALFGRSGAGKTSIINMVAGLVRPDSGHIIVNGRPLFDSNTAVDVPPEKRRIGYIFQEGRLFPHLSVRSNLTYGLRLIAEAERYVNLDQVVHLLGIEHLIDRRPARLSGGEKQRVAIGRALLTSPSLLLMDEPLASLDAARKAEVLPFIGRLSREFAIPILYVSHALEEILNLADAMVVLEGGRAVAVGSIEALMSRPDLPLLTDCSDCGAVLSTRVALHDRRSGLTHLSFSGGILKVPGFDAALGTKVRVRIEARNVAIALVPPQQISVQNILRGSITEIVPGTGSLIDVRLDIGGSLLARITAHAREDLGLMPGQEVFALIKSVAVMHDAPGWHEQRSNCCRLPAPGPLPFKANTD
ncbi:MAG: molybdenum ABC transporter ATP-binding protein [Syntrophobacteraceae bacterium CG2_30_61_12]|nr:MAG: molybdenum ABC transporter ATP-binding protein [Syntrophobacteraceae bacterium CG2_30_61_12]PIU32233.1 MAG: molybdenum ABC transporter ATP-binding protein [Syntrophobacteraceae bacterium CG07_land_8_20_14_0_80_61_8]